MTDKSHGYLQLIKEAPLGVRAALAGVWLGALVAGIASYLSGDWLHIGIYLVVVGHLTMVVSISQRSLSPSGREKVAMWAGSILIVVLSMLIIMRRFVS